MKTLETLQKLSKLGRILSKIVRIVCLVGAIACAAGIISLALFPDSVKIGNVTVYGLVKLPENISAGTCYTALAMGLILCAGETALARLAEKYFMRELTAGTPFTFDGAKELIRLGICAICIPLGTKILAEITYGVMAHLMQDVAKLDPGDAVSVGLGVMMIVAGLLCRYGAESKR
ncbi:MAG: hypothetical protein K5663_06155 [Clostridiales bacterium]|nr:hypothetical protein [Clostridiales bacterium]